VAEPLRELARTWPHVRWGSYPERTPEGWTLRLVIRAEEEEALDEAETALRALLRRIENRGEE
jgi:hypothetical protein